MNTITRLLTTLGLLLATASASAAGLLTPKNSGQAPLEISEHHVEVLVEDGYAMTSVTQIFHNPHPNDLEAIYSFPVPTKGAVAEFTVWIDGKPVTGEVVEKERAREIYEQEKSVGNDVGLTEQKGFQTFETSVSPIRAGQDTKIQIRYYQTADVDLGVGRWVYQLEEGGVDEEALAFWETNTKVTKAFSFKFHLRSGYPVDAIRLPNHVQANVQKISEQEWIVTLDKQGNTIAPAQANDDVVVTQLAQTYQLANPEEELSVQATSGSNVALNLEQDLVVYWRLKEGLPGSVDLVTYRPDPAKKGTFMMVFTPGEELTPIVEGSDWTFVLDISGSMQGKFASLVEGVSRAVENMRPQDRFRIILFNNQARELTQGYTPATPESVQHYLAQLSQTMPSSGTNLYAGLQQGISKLDADRTSAILLVTDGVANVGTTEKQAFFKLVENQDVRLFTFIMGNSANQPMLEPLARRSGGFALNVSNADDIIGRVLLAKQKLTHNALHDVEVKFDGIKVSDVTPRDIGSLYRGQQLVMMGHYWQDGEAEVSFNAKLSGKKKQYTTQVEFPRQTELNPELERLWAYAKIEDLNERMQDFAGEDHKQAITDTALEYGLVTEYTSMLVLQEEQFQSYNIKRGNKQRVAKETAARQQRAKQPVRSNQADKKKPMYKKKRPSLGGGGGSGSFGGLLMVLGVMVLLRKRQELGARS